MSAKLTCFPVGNGDATRIDLASGKKVLVDYANYYDPDDPFESRVDLSKELKNDLRAAKRDYFDVVAFTHLDDDHIHGFSDFFHLDFATKYQTEDRIKIQTLWVPAAAITEEGLTGEARTLRDEARYRLRKGSGIRVFSRPERLRTWLATQGIRLEDRAHLITDAGQLAPDFSKASADKAEFFIHSPFAWRMNENEVEDRNTDSLCFQVTFLEGVQETRVLFWADNEHECMSQIVDVTRYHKREDRLKWDIFKTPHHSSYLSIGPDKGVDKTVPVPNVRWLLEDQRQDGCLMISSCKPIPYKGTAEDKDPQPPHRQAHSYYEEVAEGGDGDVRVTMEFPNKQKPKPTIVEITYLGATLIKTIPTAAGTIAAETVRAG
jgi:ribonuclease BN (tRNA processing enzyme)